METLRRITLDPAVMGGKACIRGLRVTVGTVVGLMAAGRSSEDILEGVSLSSNGKISMKPSLTPRGGSRNGKFHWHVT